METISIKKNILIIENFFYNCLRKKKNNQEIINNIRQDLEKIKTLYNI